MTTGGCGSEWCAVRITEGGRLVQTRWGEERTVSPKPVDDADEVMVKVDSWVKPKRRQAGDTDDEGTIESSRRRPRLPSAPGTWR